MLNLPKHGWMTLEFNDIDGKRAEFCASYLTDPVQDMLQLFIDLFKNKINYIPTLYCDGEGPDLYLTFTDISTIVTILGSNYKEMIQNAELEEENKTVVIYKSWDEFAKELLNDLYQNDFINQYCLDWYDEDIREEETDNLKKLISILDYCVSHEKTN